MSEPTTPVETRQADSIALTKALQLATLEPPVWVGPAQRSGKTKRPTTPNGFKDFSSDPDTIRELFTRFPGNEVAVWPGPSKLLIEDVDAKGEDNGFETLIRIEDEWCSKLSYSTPNNGEHHVWPAPAEAPGPAAPIRGYPGVDRRSGDSLCLWYGPVPSQAEWDVMHAQTLPEWLLNGPKRRTSSGGVSVKSADVAEVQEWLESLTEGPAREEYLATTEHYHDALSAITRVVEASRAFPNLPGWRETFEELADGYVHSPVATSDDRDKKVIGMVQWALAKTAGTEDLSGLQEWAQRTSADFIDLQEQMAEAQVAQQLKPTTWVEEDFSDVLDGKYQEPKPTVLRRSDGVCLFYPGLVNDLHGESESGKTFVCIEAAVQEVMAGRHVRYIDFESSRATVVGRMLLLGASRDALRAFFHYYKPDRDPLDAEDIPTIRDFQALLDAPASLVVMDGVTEAMFLSGLDPIANKDIPKFNQIPKALAKATGAAVVLIDHVVKGGNGGRFMFGAQHKLSAIDGASYLVDVEESIAKGKVGTLVLKVAKDRNSAVRSASGKFSKTDRLQTTALFQLDSTDPTRSHARVLPWSDSAQIGVIARKRSEAEAKVTAVLTVQPVHDSMTKFKEAYREVHGEDYEDRSQTVQDMAESGKVKLTGGGPGKKLRIELAA